MNHKLYKLGEKGTYPCGCKFVKTKKGFDHIVSQNCPFDKNKQGRNYGGYRYLWVLN